MLVVSFRYPSDNIAIHNWRDQVAGEERGTYQHGSYWARHGLINERSSSFRLEEIHRCRVPPSRGAPLLVGALRRAMLHLLERIDQVVLFYGEISETNEEKLTSRKISNSVRSLAENEVRSLQQQKKPRLLPLSDPRRILSQEIVRVLFGEKNE